MDDADPSGHRQLQPSPPPLRAQNPDHDGHPAYYDISILKKPVWKWEIASYFFFGGLSASAYVLARIADRAGGERYRALSRAGAWTAFLSLLPCPPLLIHDLGDPKRFHHMMRVFKPGSPMNLGTWLLAAYGAHATLEIGRQSFRGARAQPHGLLRRSLLAAHDAGGVVSAMAMTGYTGVLLSCTANPMWCKNPWLGPLFVASSFSSGAAAMQLAMDWRNEPVPDPNPLETIDTVARGAEALALRGYLRHAGPAARPLTRGSMKKHLRAAVGALVAGEVLKRLPVRGKTRRLTRVASSLATLAGGFCLRWAMVHGGREAANDPELARLATNRGKQLPDGRMPARRGRPRHA